MKGKWFAFGCLTSVIIIILMLVSTIFSINSLSKISYEPNRAKLLENSTLHFKMTGEIVEYNEFKEDILSSPFMPNSSAAYDIIDKIKMAKYDPKITSLLIEPRWISTGYATLHEIGLAINDFKQSGKPVYAYLEVNGDKDYLLASYADEIFLNPSASAGIMLTGVGGTRLFYKDFFKKIGVEMTVLHAGQYKGAGENYYRNGYSKPVKDNLSLLYNELFNKIILTISENRNISYQQVKYIFEERDELFIKKNKAIEYKLVDGLEFKENLINRIVQNKDHLVSASKYKVKRKIIKNQPKIATLYLQGQISPQTSEYQANVLSAQKVSKAIDDIMKDDNIKGVVLRINSPGGSALESEIIHSKLKKLRNKMPVVVSMSNVAASGGYYISTPSDYVIADPFTITGSIGVVAMFPNISDLKDKVSLSTDSISKGKFANALNIYTKPDKAFLESFKRGIDETYTEFKSRVSEGRNISLEDVEKVAQGQVWFSTSALKNKLVDELGSIESSQKKVASLADIDNYITESYPKQVSFFEELVMEKLQVAAKNNLTPELIRNLQLQEQLDTILRIKNNPIQMLLPFFETTR
jgi:protease-4